MSQQSYSASVCCKWILNSHLDFFFLCYYRYKGFKGNCSFSFIEQFRALHQCNEYCEMLGLKSLRTTHQKQRKTTSTKSKNLPNSSTVKKMVPKKAREPRDFISSEHWVSLSHPVKLLLRTWSSDKHQWPEGITLVFCLLTLFGNHPDVDASNKGRSWSSAFGAWDLTLGQGFENKLSHFLDFLTGFCGLVLEKNISVSTSMALWFSCYGNINIFKMLSTSFAQYCICICMLGYLEVRKGDVWNTLMNIKVTTSIANQSIISFEPKSWTIQWDLGSSVHCWYLAFNRPLEVPTNDACFLQ